MTHAAEVAFAFFADVGRKQDGDSGGEFGMAHGGGEAKQGGQAGGIVAGAGGEDAGVDFGGFGRGPGREDGVKVGGEKDDRRGSRFKARSPRGKFGEGVAGGIQVRIGEAELAETFEKPCSAGLLAKGWGRNAEKLELPLAELKLVDVQPVEGAMHRGRGGETRDAELSGGVHSSGASYKVLGARFGIFHVDEKKALRRGGWAGSGAVACSQQIGDGVRRNAVRTGLNERADQVADHVVEESVGSDAVEKQAFVRAAMRSG